MIALSWYTCMYTCISMNVMLHFVVRWEPGLLACFLTLTAMPQPRGGPTTMQLQWMFAEAAVHTRNFLVVTTHVLKFLRIGERKCMEIFALLLSFVISLKESWAASLLPNPNRHASTQRRSYNHATTLMNQEFIKLAFTQSSYIQCIEYRGL